MEKKETEERKNPVLMTALFLIILGAAAFLIYVYLNTPHENIVIPLVNNTAPENNTPPVKITICDHDRVCDAGENVDGCPGDCILSTGLSAVRSNESSSADTTPTVTVRMQDPEGIQSCGTSSTDSLQWNCVVREPGAIATDVDCTLKNYGLDGVYMMILRCKNTNGEDVTPVMMDDIIICADSLGCKR